MDDFERAIKELEKSEKELNDWIDAYSENRLYYPLEVREAIKTFGKYGMFSFEGDYASKFEKDYLSQNKQYEITDDLKKLILKMATDYNNMEQQILWTKFDPQFKRTAYWTWNSQADGTSVIGAKFDLN